jgi:hypothetical protein
LFVFLLSLFESSAAAQSPVVLAEIQTAGRSSFFLTPDVVTLTGNVIFLLRYSTGETLKVVMPFPVADAERTLSAENTPAFAAFVDRLTDGVPQSTLEAKLCFEVTPEWQGIYGDGFCFAGSSTEPGMMSRTRDLATFVVTHLRLTITRATVVDEEGTRTVDGQATWEIWGLPPSENAPPVAVAGADQQVVAAGSYATDVHITALASFDPDGDPLRYRWGALSAPSLGQPTRSGCCPAPTISF